MTKLQKKNSLTSFVASLLGAAVAVANAWITIDWINFDIKNEYPKLILSGIIAFGGYVSRIKTSTDSTENK